MNKSEKSELQIIRREQINNEDIKYRYTLFAKESSSVASYGIKLYSVMIEMTMPDGSRTQSEAKEVFSDHKTALNFFEKLVNNLATPMNLCYVLEDEFAK